MSSFIKPVLKSTLKQFFNFILILLTLVTVAQILDSLSPIYIQAAEKETQRSLDKNSKKQERNKVDLAAKNDARYKQLEFDNSTYNCTNPIGFSEDVSKKEANIRYFWVPKNKDVPRNLTNESNPEYFTKVVCSYATPVNYKDKTDGKFKIIDNTLVELDKKDPNSKNYQYTNGGNDFKVYFGSNPNTGFWFKSPEDLDFKVTKVSISDKDLNFDSKNSPKLDGSSITQKDVRR